MHTSRELRKFQRRLKRKPAPTEAVFMRRLQVAGIEFKFQPIVGFYIPDFVFPDRMRIPGEGERRSGVKVNGIPG